MNSKIDLHNPKFKKIKYINSSFVTMRLMQWITMKQGVLRTAHGLKYLIQSWFCENVYFRPSSYVEEHLNIKYIICCGFVSPNNWWTMCLWTSSSSTFFSEIFPLPIHAIKSLELEWNGIEWEQNDKILRFQKKRHNLSISLFIVLQIEMNDGEIVCIFRIF